MPKISNSTAMPGIYRKVTKGAVLPSGPCRALWVGTAGSANITDYDGVAATNFPLKAGLNPGCVSVETGGTADDIWACY